MQPLVATVKDQPVPSVLRSLDDIKLASYTSVEGVHLTCCTSITQRNCQKSEQILFTYSRICSMSYIGPSKNVNFYKLIGPNSIFSKGEWYSVSSLKITKLFEELSLSRHNGQGAERHALLFSYIFRTSPASVKQNHDVIASEIIHVF